MKKAIDTSVLARIITQDDPHQAKLAANAITTPVFISLTVLMETAWLLSSRYRFSRAAVVNSLIDILDLSSVDCEQEVLARWALSRFADGAAIGDMLHLVSARNHAAFLTFDQKMAKEAGPDTPVPIEVLA